MKTLKHQPFRVQCHRWSHLLCHFLLLFCRCFRCWGHTARYVNAICNLALEVRPASSVQANGIFYSSHPQIILLQREKNNFYEESVRIPLLISWPGRIPPNTVVEEMASHLDIFATILDYADGTEHDHSDGVSLRRFIEGAEINAQYEEDVVLAEWDYRKPVITNESSAMELSMDRPIDDRPSFLVRHGPYKLMMQKLASSIQMDMMFDLSKDPFEIQNLLSPNKAMTQDDGVIAKAEHLRCLLLDWMQRLDGKAHYFSDAVANHGDSDGDMTEIRLRQRWKQLGFWVSDDVMEFGRLSWNGNTYVRHEHLYMGTRQEETVQITTIVLEGPDAQYFHVDLTQITLKYQECHHVRISFVAPDAVWRDHSMDATLVLTVELNGSTTSSQKRISMNVPQTRVIPNQVSSTSRAENSVLQEGDMKDEEDADGKTP
jgi:hypothetical protein